MSWQFALSGPNFGKGYGLMCYQKNKGDPIPAPTSNIGAYNTELVINDDNIITWYNCQANTGNSIKEPYLSSFYLRGGPNGVFNGPSSMYGKNGYYYTPCTSSSDGKTPVRDGMITRYYTQPVVGPKIPPTASSCTRQKSG